MGKECGSNVSSRFFRGSVAWHPERRLRRRLLAKRPENTALENVDEVLITNGFINQAKINVFTADILEGKSLL